MNGFKLTAAALSLCLCLLSVACSQNTAGPATPPPASMPELESIVEPLENAESIAPEMDEEETAIAPEPVPEPEPAPEPEPKPEPKPEPEPVGAGAGEPVALPEAGKPVAADKEPAPEMYGDTSSERELLNAVAPNQRLERKLIERELLRLINELREEAGVEALGIQSEMRFASRIRSGEALESFSHTRPDGTPYNTAFDEAGFSYAGKWHGENLAYLDFTDGMFDEKAVALEMFNGLKGSPGHRRNMTNENYLQAGIGVSIKYEKDMVYIASAQLFASL